MSAHERVGVWRLAFGVWRSAFRAGGPGGIASSRSVVAEAEYLS